MSRRSARINKDLQGATGSVAIKAKPTKAKVTLQKGIRGPNKVVEFVGPNDHFYTIQAKDDKGRTITHKVLGLVIDSSTADLKEFIEATNSKGYNIMKMLDDMDKLFGRYSHGLPLPYAANSPIGKGLKFRGGKSQPIMGGVFAPDNDDIAPAQADIAPAPIPSSL